jgi:hypothetical protein
MKEEFLQFIWKNRLFDNEGLHTADGDSVEVLKTGMQNTNSGPDFFDARIKIGDTVWAGNVEVHQKTSDWVKHKHHLDDSYKNVILHVVAENDKPVNARTKIPVFILKWASFIEENYNVLVSCSSWCSCTDYLKQADPYRIKFFLNRLIADRIRQKKEIIDEILVNTRGDWSESFYQMLARSFGFKENGLPFEMLARSLPQKILGRHHDSMFQIEALVFGQAGLLSEEMFDDNYYLALRTEYRFLAKKYALKPIEGHLWKFMRIRPMNFPTIRLDFLCYY